MNLKTILVLFCRSSTINEWKILCNDLKIPSSDNYSLIEVLGDPTKIQNWTINGLPLDSFSIDNAIIMDGSQRWSLLIDPQGQAHKWIKTLEKHNDIIIIKLTNPNYMKSIEVGIEVGKPVLIENVLEDLDLPLDPILLKLAYKQGDYITLVYVILTVDNMFINYRIVYNIFNIPCIACCQVCLNVI